MIHLLVQFSKYLIMFLFLAYTYQCFYVFRFEADAGRQKRIYLFQRLLLFLIHFDAFFVLYLTSKDVRVIGLYLMQAVLLAMIFTAYHVFYQHASELVLNNMCMLLAIGFIILTRLDIGRAFRQFLFACAGFVVSLLIPLILSHTSFFRRLTWLYAGLGIGALALVAAAGAVSYGAKLSLSFGPVTVQPSEFVKLVFVLFLASMLYRRHDTVQVVFTAGISAVFVLVLVISKDLGGAFLYFFTCVIVIYVASRRAVYLGAGLLAMTAAALAGWRLFSHVQTRVLAWLDPVSVIDDEGYQICQSLFAIGTGGWFGLGLNQGLPNKIPVVSKDFIFSAISEELGGVFVLCMVMVCMSCFLMIMNVAMKLKDPFYQLTALGFGTLYATQVFLTVGGVIKFIPSTGVTLPLVSYGGSSLLSTLMMFGIIQGFYIMQLGQKKTENGRKGGQNGAQKTKKAREKS